MICRREMLRAGRGFFMWWKDAFIRAEVRNETLRGRDGCDLVKVDKHNKYLSASSNLSGYIKI